MRLSIVLLIATQFPLAASAASLPSREGLCAWTKITRVEQRLAKRNHGPDIPGSGSAVEFANGGYQVSYDEVDAVNHSRRGDRVLICLVKIPARCPPGDDRGRLYTTTNLRTDESWTLRDAEHMCGGA